MGMVDIIGGDDSELQLLGSTIALTLSLITYLSLTTYHTYHVTFLDTKMFAPQKQCLEDDFVFGMAYFRGQTVTFREDISLEFVHI